MKCDKCFKDFYPEEQRNFNDVKIIGFVRVKCPHCGTSIKIKQR